MNQLPVNGKGVYIWRPQNIKKGNPIAIADECERANLSHVCIKIHNGWYVYDDIQPTIDELRKRGIVVGGWGYIYIRYNQTYEADAAIEAIKRYNPAYYLMDAEGYAKGYKANILPKKIRSAYPDLPLALNSYWKPSYHPELDWKAFREVSDFDAPQMYWRNRDPIGKIRTSMSEYAAMKPKLPYSMPAGEIYREYGIESTPEQVIQFLDFCQEDDEIQACLMWAMDQNETTPSLWEVFSSYRWSTHTLPKKLDAFLAGCSQNIRKRPDHYQAMYDQAASGTLPKVNTHEEEAALAGILKLLECET